MVTEKPQEMPGFGLFLTGAVLLFIQLLLLAFLAFLNESVPRSQVLLVCWAMVVAIALMIGGVRTGQAARKQ